MSEDEEDKPEEKPIIIHRARIWQPVDFIIAAITITICGAIIASIVTAEQRRTIEEGKANEFLKVIGLLLSIVSMYVGAKLQRGRDDDDKFV